MEWGIRIVQNHQQKVLFLFGQLSSACLITVASQPSTLTDVEVILVEEELGF
ncbi:hypothetical protein HKBW3S06_00969 [Candidatus Hakubella thermalkaliphila]|uniref:Uncharacterized protein n=1 Tax=Candidatus Hakubella thermalkaliphila TaxID=2754717 RepID=A0A6V8NN27_9ACTN|nr:hypothetical protein [Candidatus Hakubella thermalkaliphila]GFP21742.1 hypothetical protein HKBW3S06_00969 [Candidatus Hakubella thermalkaliphila]